MNTTTTNRLDMSLTGAAAAGVKMYNGWALASTAGAALSAFVVMCLTPPQKPKEWALCLITTAISSICGGAFVIAKLELQHWAFDDVGLLAMLGLVFACGLPGWAIVRWAFNYINKHRNDDIGDICDDVRDHFK